MRFVITGINPCDPQTHKNAGGRALMYLHKLILMAGYDCDIDRPVRGDDIVIYPDCIQGNPNNAKRIVRYMLFFWHGHQIPKDECVIVYHPAYLEQVASKYDGTLTSENVVKLPTIQPELYYPEPKTVEAVIYTGKQTVTDRPPGDFPEINKFNRSREDCAKLLREAKNLYSQDHYTIILHEALLAGCKPWLIMPGGELKEPELLPMADEIMNLERDVALGKRFVEIADAFFKNGEPTNPS